MNSSNCTKWNTSEMLSCGSAERMRAMAEWIDVNDRLPETADAVLVVLAHIYDDSFHDYSIAQYIPSDDGSHWADIVRGYLEWDRYPCGCGGSSFYKVIAWMPIPTYKEKENG